LSICHYADFYEKKSDLAYFANPIGPLPEISKEEEMPYAFSLFQFLTKISEVIGGTSVTIFRSAIDGYNKRFNKEAQVKDTIKQASLLAKCYMRV